MGVRILLVSVVAGLGLGLPSVNQVGEWRAAAQGWVNERLAEYDARMPVDENAFVIAPGPPVVETLALAPTPAPQTVETTAPVEAQAQAEPTPTTIVVTHEELAAGMDTPTRPMDLDETPAAPAPAPVPTLTSAPAPALVAPASDAEFVAAQDDFVTGYTIERAAADASLASAEVDFDLESGLTNGRTLQAEAEALKAPNLSAPTTMASTLPAEGTEVAENLYDGLAYELNRDAEGLEPTPALTATAALRPADRAGRLTTAVRLTREAVHAWANLLHGPAVVTIGE